MERQTLLLLLNACLVVILMVSLPVTLFGQENPVERQREAKLTRVSAYCQNSCCCGRWADNHFADNALCSDAKDYSVIACDWLPLGTWVEIETVGTCLVRDRMGSGNRHNIDLFFSEPNGHQKALNWGVKYLEARY